MRRGAATYTLNSDGQVASAPVAGGWDDATPWQSGDYQVTLNHYTVDPTLSYGGSGFNSFRFPNANGRQDILLHQNFGHDTTNTLSKFSQGCLVVPPSLLTRALQQVHDYNVELQQYNDQVRQCSQQVQQYNAQISLYNQQTGSHLPTLSNLSIQPAMKTVAVSVSGGDEHPLLSIEARKTNYSNDEFVKLNVPADHRAKLVAQLEEVLRNA